jgi:hypothetical protein
LKNKFKKYDHLVLNIAKRGQSTTQANLELGKQWAYQRWSKKYGQNHTCDVQFNVQQPTNEPLLNLADYFCWSIQRVFEKGETRFYELIQDKISLILDLYPPNGYGPELDNYHRRGNPLTAKNRID